MSDTSKVAVTNVTANVPFKKSEFRKDINGLRAFAVLLVVFFHFGVPYFSAGFIGVDIFFVISGYLMTGIIVSKGLQDKFSILDFYMARARRIIPALLALCFFLLIFGMLFIPPIEFKSLANHIVSSVFFVSNITYFRESGYFDVASQQKWLLHTWSLSAEWQFYLIYPVVIAAALKIRRTEKTIFFLLISILVFSFGLSVWLSIYKPKAAFFLLPTRAWEMVAGGLVFALANYIKLNKLSAKLVEYISLGLLIIAMFLLDEGDVWPGYLAALPVIGTSLLILANSQTSTLTNNSLVQKIGDASYSIYLWHWPISVFIRFYDLNVGWLSITFGITLSCIMGYFSYRLIENPSRSWLSNKTNFIGWSTISATILLVCILAVGVWITNGVNSRVNDKNYISLANSSSDWKFPDSHCSSFGGDGNKCILLGNKDTRRIVVIGDSHAEQWYPRFVKYADNNAIKRPEIVFLTLGGCPASSGISRVKPGIRCTTFTDQVWNYVTHEKIDRLVIASRWVQYFYREDGLIASSLCFAKNDHCFKNVTSSTDISIVFNQLTQKLLLLKKRDIDIQIIGPVPGNNDNYPYLKSKEIAALHLPLMHLAYKQQQPDSFLLEVAGRHEILTQLQVVANATGATFTDPGSIMCSNGMCSYVNKDHISMYRDENHLTASTVEKGDFIWLDHIIFD